MAPGESSINPVARDISFVINAVDKLEDELEIRTFDDFPQHVKFALEERVFGWSNLSFSILGHILCTAGAYCVTLQCLDSIPLYYYSTETVFLKHLVSFVAAFCVFRVVRRRRYVWLRAPYGSKCYQQDVERRRKEVAETDYSTLLGHLRRRNQVYLQERQQRRLTEAEDVFASWKEKRRTCVEVVSPSINNGIETRSIENDQAVFTSGSIKKMPYAHGGFFGAAPFMLADPDWITILRKLMPDVYIEISKRVLHAPARRLIHWAENNPVVAAYGNTNTLEKSGNLVALEWDVFLDPRLVRRIEDLHAQQETLQSSGDEKKKKQVLALLDAELERQSTQLVDKMVIAHGNLSQLLLEQTGFAKDYNYSRVKRTRSTLGGGMYARQWMAVYAEATKLGHRATVAKNEDDSSVCSGYTEATSDDESCDMDLSATSHTTIEGIFSPTCPNTSIRESVELLKGVIKKDKPIGLVLDLKSRHVSKRVWSMVVNKLNDAGICVEGVASFAMDEIRGISCFCDQPLSEIFFCHSAGDMQRACHEGRIQNGDTVMFNGGSMLWETLGLDLKRMFCKERETEYVPLPFATKKGGSSSIQAYKEALNLKLGIYVQEFAIDEGALNMLVKFVNENANVFEQGFCWGGINGVTVGGILPNHWTSTDGFDTQRYAGISWNYALSADHVGLVAVDRK